MLVKTLDCKARGLCKFAPPWVSRRRMELPHPDGISVYNVQIHIMYNYIYICIFMCIIRIHFFFSAYPFAREEREDAAFRMFFCSFEQYNSAVKMSFVIISNP